MVCIKVLTLTSHRGMTKALDEQLHVLPMYVMDDTDELGGVQLANDRIHQGALDVLHAYYQQVTD